MNRNDDPRSRQERDRDEWRRGEGRNREYGRSGSERAERESFYPGNYGFQEGENGRTAGEEWRGSQQYGQREPYNTGGGQYGASGAGPFRGDEASPPWGREAGTGGSRYSESQYGMGRGAPRGGGREPQYGGGRYGGGSEHRSGGGFDTRFDERGPFREPSFGERGESRGFFGTGYYGDGGASASGGVDWRSPSREYGSFSRDTLRDEPRRYRTGPKGYTRSDDRLREDICERLMMAGSIDSSEVTVTVKDCKVTLEGTVPTRNMKHSIEDLVDSAPGVQDIDNRVRVERESGYGVSATTPVSKSRKE